MRAEAPKGPLGRVAMEGEGHGGGFEVPEGHQGGVHQHQKKPPEEECDGEGSRGEESGGEGGPGPP